VHLAHEALGGEGGAQRGEREGDKDCTAAHLSDSGWMTTGN
jgi:hypothetical protein